MLLESIKSFFGEILNYNSGITYKYETVETICGKMTPEQVLELINPIVVEANLFHQNDETIIEPYYPSLQENLETGHHLWQIVLIYREIKGKPLEKDKSKVYLYLVVDDETKEITEIYPRPDE